MSALPMTATVQFVPLVDSAGSRLTLVSWQMSATIVGDSSRPSYPSSACTLCYVARFRAGRSKRSPPPEPSKRERPSGTPSPASPLAGAAAIGTSRHYSSGDRPRSGRMRTRRSAHPEIRQSVGALLCCDRGRFAAGECRAQGLRTQRGLGFAGSTTGSLR